MNSGPTPIPPDNGTNESTSVSQPSLPRPEPTPRLDRIAHLQTLLLATILSLLVLALGVNLFIFRQMQGARAQLTASRLLNRNLSEQYQAKEPTMRQFIQSLQTYAATHPEFQPILHRYRSGLAQFFTDAPIARPGSLQPIADPKFNGNRR